MRISDWSSDVCSSDLSMTDPKTEKPLDPMAHHVLREGGTERAFTGKYTDHKGDGGYHSAGCGARLFDSRTKYDSGSGWPSYPAPAEDGAVPCRTGVAKGTSVHVGVDLGGCRSH